MSTFSAPRAAGIRQLAVPLIILTLALVNLIHWYLHSGVFVISDDAEYWNGAVLGYRGIAGFNWNGLLAMLGGRGTAIPYVGFALLELFHGSITKSNIAYSCFAFAFFLLGVYRLGRALKVSPVWLSVILAIVGTEPFVFRSFICLFAEPFYLAGMAWGAAFLVEKRFYAAGLAMGFATWFRPFESVRMVGIGALSFFFVELVWGRDRKKNVVRFLATLAGLILFRLNAGGLSAWLCVLPCGFFFLRALREKREPGVWAFLFTFFFLLAVWFDFCGPIAWAWVQSSSGAPGGVSVATLLAGSLPHSVYYVARVVVLMLGVPGLTVCLAVIAVLVWFRDRALPLPWRPLLVAAMVWTSVCMLAGLAPNRESATAYSRFFVGENLFFLAALYYLLASAKHVALRALLCVSLLANLAGVYAVNYGGGFSTYLVYSAAPWFFRGVPELSYFGENAFSRGLYDSVAAGENPEQPLVFAVVPKDPGSWEADHLNLYFVDRGDTHWSVDRSVSNYGRHYVGAISTFQDRHVARLVVENGADPRFLDWANSNMKFLKEFKVEERSFREYAWNDHS
jgi:hypothetical protein